MDHVLLDLRHMADIGDEELLFGLDVELHDLAIFQLDQVDFAGHSLDVVNSVARHFDDFFASGDRRVVETKRANFGRSDQEIARYLVDPDGPAHLSLRLFELHASLWHLGRVEEYLSVGSNHEEHLLTGTVDDVLHHGGHSLALDSLRHGETGFLLQVLAVYESNLSIGWAKH